MCRQTWGLRKPRGRDSATPGLLPARAGHTGRPLSGEAGVAGPFQLRWHASEFHRRPLCPCHPGGPVGQRRRARPEETPVHAMPAAPAPPHLQAHGRKTLVLRELRPSSQRRLTGSCGCLLPLHPEFPFSTERREPEALPWHGGLSPPSCLSCATLASPRCWPWHSEPRKAWACPAAAIPRH